MATDKRKRAIRALAAERGVSYTAAMRLHDEGTITRQPPSILFAGERTLLDTPLLLLADTGAGSLLLGAATAVEAAAEGAEVVVLGDREPVLPPRHTADAPAPGAITEATSTLMSSRMREMTDYLNAEFTRRAGVLKDHQASHWLNLPDEVRERERMNHPVLVIENQDPQGTDTSEGGALMRKTCERIRRMGRIAGFCSLSIRMGGATARTLEQVRGFQFTKVALGRHGTLDSGTTALVETFHENPDRQECLDALPLLPSGHVLMLEAGSEPQVRWLDPAPYAPLFRA